MTHWAARGWHVCGADGCSGRMGRAIATATAAGLGLAGTIMGTVNRLFNGVRLVDGLR